MLLRSVEHNKFHMIFRSNWKKIRSSITTLPEEIIFHILVRLPAHVLYNVMRCVCRQWRRIIEGPQFVSTHFQLASSTLLMHPRKMYLSDIIHTYRLLDVRGCRAKLSGFGFQIPSTHDIYTCNGLMLFFRGEGERRNSTHYVGNPITRKLLALPQLPLPIIHYGIAFEASSEVYKVVVVYRTEIWSRKPFEHRCAILTVGIDKAWRFLDCAHLTDEDMELLDERPPMTSTDFVYWVPTSHTYMLALDLKCESIKRISLPFPYECLRDLKYLPKGNSITVWYTKSDFSIEVWLLKDFISEEWILFLNIDGEPIRNELSKALPNDIASYAELFRYIIPRSWLGNGERILFHAHLYVTHLFVYDLKTRDCCSFNVEYGKFDNIMLQSFVNSLTQVC